MSTFLATVSSDSDLGGGGGGLGGGAVAAIVISVLLIVAVAMVVGAVIFIFFYFKGKINPKGESYGMCVIESNTCTCFTGILQSYVFLDNQVYCEQSYSMGENTNHPTTKQQAHIHGSHIVTQCAQDYEMQGSTEAAQDYEKTNGAAHSDMYEMDNIKHPATVTTGENYAAYSYATHEVHCLYSVM